MSLLLKIISHWTQWVTEFIAKRQKVENVIVIIWVDDSITAAINGEILKCFKEMLSDRIKMDFGETQLFLSTFY